MENSALITIVVPVKGNDDALRYSLILEPCLKKLNAEFIVVTDEDLDNKFSDSNFDFNSDKRSVDLFCRSTGDQYLHEAKYHSGSVEESGVQNQLRPILA